MLHSNILVVSYLTKLECSRERIVPGMIGKLDFDLTYHEAECVLADGASCSCLQGGGRPLPPDLVLCILHRMHLTDIPDDSI